MNKLLYPFSILYFFLSKADRFFTKSGSLGRPVISVGNLTWGGTGKTPVVIELLEFLAKQNLRTAVLTRGYGRAGNKSVLIKSGGCAISPDEGGDEPLLIAKSAPDAFVIVGADRYGNALKYQKELNPDVFVLDDGFQHWKIKRDLDIVCVNAADPFGNGMIIPAGILREYPEALRRAGFVIITNADMVARAELENLKERIRRYCAKEPAVTYYGGMSYKQIDLLNAFDMEKIKDKGACSLCGVGFSEGFRNSIEKTGVKVKNSFVLRDHEKYDKKTIYEILEKAGESYLITTAKDAVKIACFADDKIKEKTAVLTVKPVFETGKELWEKTILESLRYS